MNDTLQVCAILLGNIFLPFLIKGMGESQERLEIRLHVLSAFQFHVLVYMSENIILLCIKYRDCGQLVLDNIKNKLSTVPIFDTQYYLRYNIT